MKITVKLKSFTATLFKAQLKMVYMQNKIEISNVVKECEEPVDDYGKESYITVLFKTLKN